MYRTGFGRSIRKSRSFVVRAARWVASRYRVLVVRLFNQGAVIPWSASIGRGVTIRVTDEGGVLFGADVTVGANCEIVAQGGLIEIGAGTFLGRGSVIVCKDSIRIGEHALIAEYVTIRDQDHRVDCSGPIGGSGFDCSPIEIGNDVWLGAKASVFRGTRIGAHAVIGAHALVKGGVPAHAVAVGIPARVVRYRKNCDDC